MKTNKRRIMPAILAVVMVMSLAAFIPSCGESEKEQKITVQMKIIGSEGVILDTPIVREGAPSDFTVLDLTKFICDIYETAFDFDVELKTVKRIGDKDIVKFFLSEYPTDPPPTEKETKPPEEGEEEEETEAPTEKETVPEDVLGEYYYDWVCTINDNVDANILDLLKNGDSVVWEWKLVKSELD